MDEIVVERLGAMDGYFLDEGRYFCEKCNLPYWRPDWHGKVPCQAGCPKPWQDGAQGVEHVIWTSPCGWRRWSHIARTDEPVVIDYRDT